MKFHRTDGSFRPCFFRTCFLGTYWYWVLLTAILAVSARSLFGQETPELRIRPLPGTKADVAALLFAGTEGGSLWTAAAVLPSATGDRLELSFEVGGRSLLQAHDPVPPKLRLEIYAYLLAGPKLIDSFAGRLDLDTTVHGERLGATGLRVGLPFSAPPGVYDLRLLVRDRAGQSYSLRRLGAELRNPTGEPALRVPIRGDWLTAGVEDRWFEPFDPWPVWVMGRSEAVPPGPASQGGLELVDETDQPIPGCSVRWQGEQLRIAGGTDCTGSRRIRPVGRGSSWSLPILLLEGQWGDQTLSWAQIRRLVENPEERQEMRTQDLEGRRSKRVAALVQAYEGVLDQLVAGEVDRAVDSLIAIDSELFAAAEAGAGRQAEIPGTLEQAVTKLVKALAGRDPESLLPIVWLHLELHDRYVEQHQEDAFVLEATWSRIRTLAEAYAEAADQEVAKNLASTVLAELGIAVDRAGLPRSALRLLEQATEVDPKNAEVWRYLVFWHERRGQVDRAVDALEILLELRPELDDARLRWAIGLRRLGRSDSALATLESILGRQVSTEVKVIAFQEAASLHTESGRFDAAIVLLEDAAARFPANQRLRLQLAQALERRPGRSPEDRRRAADLLDQLPPDSGPSPRHVYQQPPELEDSGSRQELRRHAVARLPVLAQAIAAVERREARR